MGFYLMLNEFHEYSSIEIEFLRIKKGNPMDTLGINLKLNESKNDLNEWILNYNNKKTSIEYQHNRIINMKLMNKYGIEAWRRYIFNLNNIVNYLREKIHMLRYEIRENKIKIKAIQINNGRNIDKLEKKWLNKIKRKDKKIQ